MPLTQVKQHKKGEIMFLKWPTNEIRKGGGSKKKKGGINLEKINSSKNSIA